MTGSANRSPRLFVPGLYTWGNKGDAALALSFLPWLAQSYETDSITLTSFTPEKDAGHYGYPVIDMVIRPYHRAHYLSAQLAQRIPGGKVLLTAARMAYTQMIMWYLTLWAPLFLRNPGLAKRLVPAHVNRVAVAIADADEVVSIPGGYLNALHHTDDLWLFHLPTFRLSVALGKPAILGPCSIGPFTRAHRGFARRTLLRTRQILVREDRSMGILRELRIPDTLLTRTPDMAFALPLEQQTATGLSTIARVATFAKDREILGVSVRDHSFPGHSDRERMQREYLGHVADAVASRVQDKAPIIVIVPQTMEDIPVGRDLLTILNTRYPLVASLAVEDDLSPSDLVALYDRFRLLVGTRMHANILAMSTCTPVAAIAYEPKTMGILDRMGLPEWGIEIDRLDDGRLKDLVSRQWEAAHALGPLAGLRAAEQRAQLDAIGSQLAAQSPRLTKHLGYHAPR